MVICAIWLIPSAISAKAVVVSKLLPPSERITATYFGSSAGKNPQNQLLLIFTPFLSFFPVCAVAVLPAAVTVFGAAAAAPEYNKIAFDDCTITLKGADGYALDVDNTVNKDEISEEVVKKVIRTDPNHIFENTISGVGGVIAIVTAIAGGAVVIAAGVLLIIFRKKIFIKKLKR